jgi:hypothetical protein
MANHYLKVDGYKWEMTETDRFTGRQRRQQFAVPRFLDVGDPGDWTITYSKDEGDIVVSNGGTHEARDVIFIGDPTPDMLPLDDEAKAISDSFAKLWRRSAENQLSGKSYTDELMDKMHEQMAALQAAVAAPAQQTQGFGEAMAMMSEVMKQNQQIMEKLVARRP